MDAVATALTLSSWVAIARMIALRLDPDADLASHAAQAGLFTLWAFVVSAEMLGAVHLFGRWMLPALWVSGWVCARRLSWTAPALRLPGPKVRLAVALAALVCGLQALRAAVAPPLGWDALTYHLVTAGRWIQGGGKVWEPASGVWSYYEHFPEAGALVWAQVMLPSHSTLWVGLASCAIALTLAIAVGALARALGSSRDAAWGAGALTMVIPAVSVFAPAAYVDNTLALAWALTGIAIVRVSQHSTLGAVASVCAGIGLVGAIKASGLPTLLFGELLVVGWALRERRMVAVPALALITLLPGAAHWIRTMLAAGNPIYPLSLPVGPESGNALLSATISGALRPDGPFFEPMMIALELFVRDHHPVAQHKNFGVAPLVLLVPAVIGALQRGVPASRVWLVGTAVLSVIPLLPPENRELWSLWAHLNGRLLLPAALAVIALSARRMGHPGVWLALVSLSLIQGFPRWWGAWEMVPMTLAAASAGAALWAVNRWGHRAAVPALAGFLLVTGVLADRWRTTWWEAAASNSARLVAVLNPEAASPAVWEELDDGKGHRVSFHAGFEYPGHAVYRLPLMGTYLQNEVVYVSPTASGAIPESWRRPVEVDRRAWARALAARGVDRVVTSPPRPAVESVLENSCAIALIRDDGVTLWDTSCFRVEGPKL